LQRTDRAIDPPMSTPRRGPLVAALVFTLALPSTGRAEDPIAPAAAPTIAPSTAPTPQAALGPDEVLLRNGGFVRGTIVEVVPDTRVVILVDGSGERREIPWDEVAEVERDKHAPPFAEPTPPPTAAPADGPTVGRGRPRVHLELTRDRPVTLFEIDSEIVASGYNASMYGMKFRSVCAAPCDAVVDGSRGQEFFLGTGEGAVWTASRKFTLAEREGPLDIRVKPGSRALRIIGAVVLGIGIGATIGGGVLAVPKSTRTPGLILLAVGVPGLLAGIPMIVFGRTRYELGARDTTDEP
jgi:hypothetical protein